MVTAKRRFWKLLPVLLVLGSVLYAQEGISWPVKTEEGIVIYQRIPFSAVPDADVYEIEIEHQAGEQYIPLDKLEAKENYIETALRAGNYRYRITAYGRNGLLEGRSGWQNITVFPALQPEAFTYQPFYGLFHEMSRTGGSITVTGRDFSTEAEFALVPHEAKPDWLGVSLKNNKRVIFPDHAAVDSSSATLHFSRKSIKTGNYDILIRNPGGLWTTLGEVRVGNKNNADLTFSFGYSPAFALFDTENALNYDDYSNPVQTIDSFTPIGNYIRFGFIPVKTSIGNFGLEAQFNFLADKKPWHKELPGIGSFFETMRFATINLLYQYSFANRFQHNVRLGIGIGEPYHTYGEPDVDIAGNDYYKHEDYSLFVYNSFGYSIQYFFWKNLYVEAGIDVIYSYGVNIFNIHGENRNHDHFMIRPGIGIGWQAGRWEDYAQVAEGAKAGKDYSVPVTENPKPEQLLSIGWAPMIPISGINQYGWIKPGYDAAGNPIGGVWGDEFIKPFNPLGLNIRYAYIPYRWGVNKLGYEFEISILSHLHSRDEFWPMDKYWDLLSEIIFGIRYQRVLNENWQLNFRTGFGMSNNYYYNRWNEKEEDPSTGQAVPGTDYWGWNGMSYTCKLGASAQYFIRNGFYAEVSLDLTVIENWRNKNTDSPSLYLKPGIAFGYQYKRNNETGLRLTGSGLPWAKPKPSDN